MANARVSVLIDMRSRLAALDRATAGFGRLLRNVLAVTGAYLGFRAIARQGRATLALGAELDHLSKQTEIAVSDLMALRQAFEDNGVAPQRVGRAVNDMQRRIAEAARGIGEGRQALRDLNLEATELARLSPADQFALLAERIGEIENPAQRTNTAMALLGKSGADLLPLFQSGGAIDEARESLGKLPEVMERNAEQFERIDTLMGRMPNKSRQLFAGLGDQLAGHLSEPLERLNRLDLTGMGQRIGAFISMGLESIQDGTFSEFISLAIEAGFEQGLAGARRMLDAFGTDGVWMRTLGAASMTIGVGLAKLASDALGFLSLFSAHLSVGFTFGFEKAREGWGKLKDILLAGLAEVINFFSTRIETVLNRAIAWANRIPGVNIGQASIGRVDFTGSEEGFTARSFADILHEAQAAVVDRADARRAALESNLQASLRAIGAETDATDEQASATERLNQLIAERIALREQEDPQAPGVPPVFAGAPGPESFADKSQERFEEFLSGSGDFGVGTWTAAKAALMDYVTSAGTVAQQVYSAIGGIATGLTEGISQSLSGLIERTMSWGEALRNIGTTLATSVLSAFTDMAAHWMVQRTMMFVLGRKFDAAEVASNVTKNSAIVASESATATATAAAWTPAALLKSIATFGVAAIVGLALFAAAMGSFERGGYTGAGGKYEPAGIVHRGEFVMPADVVAKRGPGYFYALMDSLRFERPAPSLAGYAAGGLVGLDSQPARSSTTAAGDSPTQRPIRFVMVDSRKDAERLRVDPEFESVIVDIARRNRGEIAT